MTADDLLGQTVVVIGGSAGIGLETARRARAEGADAILTARNRARLDGAASEVGARSTAVFDAHDLAALEEFFGHLDASVDHVMVTAGRPYHSPLVEMDFDEARRGLHEHLMVMLAVARYGGDSVRPGGTLVFMGGTGVRRPGVGMGVIAATAALPALTANLAIEIALVPGEPDRRRLRRLAAVGGALDHEPEARRDQLRATLPIGRVVGPADVAALAVHLMTALTGATYDIDGGRQLVPG
jgi:NAD(P)-dependent dehydrogenase (short-subunit alcohol dehydrogenase family)